MTNKHTQLRTLFLLGLLITVMTLTFSVGCNNQLREISAELGDVAELKIGQTVFIEGEEITF